METLNLTKMNLTELHTQEMRETEGGNPILLLEMAVAIGGYAIYLYDNRERVSKGFKDGFKNG